MPGVAVVTDSTSSFAPRQAERADVRVIPLQVVIDGRSRPEGEVDAAEVAAALRAGRRVSTSRPTPEVVAAAYAELAAGACTGVVSVHLSGGISGTAQAAEVAARGASVPVRVVDSRGAAMATGFAALAAAGSARDGGDLDAVAAAASRRAGATSTWFCVDDLVHLRRGGSTWFCVDDLVHLRRGGRVSAATAVLGTALAVKPLLTVADGAIRPFERVRTSARALSRLEQLAAGAVRAGVDAGHVVDVAVHHLDNAAAAERLADALREQRPGGSVLVSELSAVLAVHVGPGTVGVVVSPAV
ncbi:DegV family protein [Microlunatus capsulatus]|uniref:DegV family protein n=1 Tax=Microlunatus capsulatus TaxID=99117 RepID=UPI0031DA1842